MVGDDGVERSEVLPSAQPVPSPAPPTEPSRTPRRVEVMLKISRVTSSRAASNNSTVLYDFDATCSKLQLGGADIDELVEWIATFLASMPSPSRNMLDLVDDIDNGVASEPRLERRDSTLVISPAVEPSLVMAALEGYVRLHPRILVDLVPFSFLALSRSSRTVSESKPAQIDALVAMAVTTENGCAILHHNAAIETIEMRARSNKPLLYRK